MNFIVDLAEALLTGVYKRFTDLEVRLSQMEYSITNAIKQLEENTMATLADIKAKVEADHEVDMSAITLLQQLSQMLKDAQASGDPAAMQEIIDLLDNNQRELADAVTANTPAAPAP